MGAAQSTRHRVRRVSRRTRIIAAETRNKIAFLGGHGISPVANGGEQLPASNRGRGGTRPPRTKVPLINNKMGNSQRSVMVCFHADTLHDRSRLRVKPTVRPWITRLSFGYLSTERCPAADGNSLGEVDEQLNSSRSESFLSKIVDALSNEV